MKDEIKNKKVISDLANFNVLSNLHIYAQFVRLTR